ncbi:MAG: trigger factor [Porticoccaceae bacterium]
MQVSVEATTGLERRMTVSLPAADINQQVSERLKKAQKTVMIKGFRKGKVPMSVLEQRFGAGVRQEVLGELVNKSYGEALAEKEIRPAGQPTIEELEEPAKGAEEFSYTAVFEIYPEVEVGDLSKIKIETAEVEVTDSDVEEMLETLRKQSATFETVDRAAKEGDTVVIDFSGSIDGEAFEGGSAEGSSLELGSGQMIPGFESGIVGMKAGDTRNVEVTFPEDYQAENLKGKDAVFAITLSEVKERVLPEIDAEFITNFGIEGGDLEALKSEIRSNMERELEKKKLQFEKTQVMDALCDLHEIEMPQSMIKDEIARSKREMFQQYGGGQADNLDLSQLPDEPFVEQASKRVKLGLLMSELVKKEGISADADSVKKEISKMAAGYEDPEQVEQYYYSNENLLNSIQMKVLEDNVVQYIEGLAQVKPVKLSYTELMAKN